MDFNAIKSAVVAAAEKAGIKEYELYYVQDAGVSTETLKHEISNLTSAVNGGVCFRCVVDGKMGYAASELMNVEEIEALVLRAADNAKYVEADDDGVIFAGSKEYGKINAPEPKILDAAELKAMALEIEKELYEASDKVIDGSQAAVGSAEMWVRIFNSYGLDLENHVGRNYAMAYGVVNVDGEVRNDFEIKTGSTKEEFEGMARKAVEAALEQIGAKNAETGVYNVVINKSQMASLLSAYSSIFSAKVAQNGMSLLVGKEGEKIAADCRTCVCGVFFLRLRAES